MIKIGRRGSLSGTLKILGLRVILLTHIFQIIQLVLLLKFAINQKKPLDKGNKNFQPSNLEFTSIDVNNNAHNVIPATAIAKFNIRFNNLQTTNSLRKKISRIVSTTCKK